MGLYIIIFLSKALEYSLSTLRIIFVTNGRKFIGATLQGVVSFLFIAVTGVVVVDVADDPLKIVFYALGSLFGSWLGSYLEEKIAMGSNMLMSVVDISLGSTIANAIREKGFAVTVLEGKGKEKDRNVLIIMVSRKKRQSIVNIIKEFDNNAMIISESATTINGGYMNYNKNA